MDPLELAATLTLTTVVKQGIEWAEDLTTQLFNPNSVVRAILRFWPFYPGLTELFLPTIPPEELEKVKEMMDSPPAEVAQWLISFAVAYLIVHNFGSIIEAGGNILGVARTLIGSAATGI